jgi:hypothetical protein
LKETKVVVCSLLTGCHLYCIRTDDLSEEFVADDDFAEDRADDDEEEEKALLQMRQDVQNTHPYQYKDRTREYRETNYLFPNVPISPNAFWLDYLMHENNSPFLSQVGLQ